jgi:hypothetical protein
VETQQTAKVVARMHPAAVWIGLLLVLVFWPLNWLLSGMRTAYLFFPLWLGYILVVDGLVHRRTGSSLLTRSRTHFVLLFFLSAPCWWLFEIINWRTQNWTYLGSNVFTDLEYWFLCSLSFSTVMPAVFETSELALSFRWLQRCASGPRLSPTPGLMLGLLTLGCVMLLLVMLWPRYCYPFVWTSICLIIEPVNVWLGRRNFIERLRYGDWREVAALSMGALICGFFWEMWNSLSYPKWVYHTPGAQFLHVFEMPLLGYGGYLPFAWELFCLRNLLWPGAKSWRI